MEKKYVVQAFAGTALGTAAGFMASHLFNTRKKKNALCPDANVNLTTPSENEEPAACPKSMGIICAMDSEAAHVLSLMTIEKEEKISGMVFREGTLYGKHIVLVRCGIGKVNAAACAQTLCTVFKIDQLVNIGVAGTVRRGIKQGDIVISTDAIQHDYDITPLGLKPGEIGNMHIAAFKASKDLIALAKKAANASHLNDIAICEGRIASGDQFIAGGPRMDAIKETFDPYAVEMEGAAIAHIAYLNEIPFVIIRSISDKADGEASLSYEEFLPIAAKNAGLLMENMIKLWEA